MTDGYDYDLVVVDWDDPYEGTGTVTIVRGANQYEYRIEEDGKNLLIGAIENGVDVRETFPEDQENESVGFF